MEPNNKNTQLGFSWPQWIRKKTIESGDFGDLCISPPLDDSDSFLHWSCFSHNNNQINKLDVDMDSKTGENNQTAIIDSRGNPPMSVHISSTFTATTNTTLTKSSSVGNLVDRVKEFAPGPVLSVTPSPVTTPVPSPQASPSLLKKSRRPYIPNPYFTEREADGSKSWLFRSIRKPEGEVRDETSAMSTLKSMQPNELREMNLFCPLSM